MNLPRKNVNNLLFLPKSQEYVEEVYSFMLQLILTGRTVVVVTQSAPKLLPLMKKLKIELHRSKEVLKRLIFICCENLSTAIRKLSNLHDWTVKPNIIIIDLYTFAYTEDHLRRTSNEMTIVPFLQQLVYCIAVLFNMMNCVSNDRPKLEYHTHSQLNPSTLTKVFSIVVLQEWDAILSAPQIQLVKELYYGDNTYNDFKRIVDVLH